MCGVEELEDQGERHAGAKGVRCQNNNTACAQCPITSQAVRDTSVELHGK